MNEDKPLTGVRKRAQIDSANKQMFIWVAIAAVVVSASIVVAVNFVQQIVYQMKVNGKLGETAQILQDDIGKIDSLKTEVNKLNTNQNLNLPKLKADDSTPFQVVLDALPTSDDRVSLGASLQSKILAASGVTVESIGVSGDQTAAAPAATDATATDGTSASNTSTKPTAQPITFSVTISGGYDTVKQAILDIERTIRPMTITSLDLQGTDQNLQATIAITTYFVPKVDWATGTETVPVGDEPAATDAATTDSTTTTEAAQ